MRRVPEGSVHGPLLFVIYVNAISIASSLLRFVMFVGDAFISNKSINLLVSKINIELKLAGELLEANALSINIEKMILILFCSKRNITVVSNHRCKKR